MNHHSLKSSHCHPLSGCLLENLQGHKSLLPAFSQRDWWAVLGRGLPTGCNPYLDVRPLEPRAAYFLEDMEGLKLKKDLLQGPTLQLSMAATFSVWRLGILRGREPFICIAMETAHALLTSSK